MEYIHIRSLEKYHPGYKDRKLQWAKIYFQMVQGDPDCELIDNEVDWARLIKMILLELEAQKPLPNEDRYWTKKGFDIKKRPMSLTIKMLHNFIEVVTQLSKVCAIDKEKEEDKEKEKEKEKEKDNKTTHLEFVLLTTTEYSTLTDKFGKSNVEKYIDRLNDYVGSKGKKYKSHYYTLNNWLKRDNIKKPEEPKVLTKNEINEFYGKDVKKLIEDTTSKIGKE